MLWKSLAQREVWRSLFLVLLLAFAMHGFLLGRADVGTQASGASSAMKALSSHLRTLQSAVTAGDREAMQRAGKALREAAANAQSLPQFEGEQQRRYQAYFQSFDSLCKEVETIRESAPVGLGREVLAAIRRQCVSCHIDLRDDGSDAGCFPAQRNTLSGTVVATTKDGVRREDLSGIVVFLDSIPGEASIQAPVRRSTLAQRDRQFTHRVLPILRGTTIDFPNEDSIFHNVFSLSKAKQFDLGIYSAGASKSVTFEKAGLVQVYCQIHPDMVANILVLNNPYFAVTNKDGFFVLTDIPDGTHKLRVWNELGGTVRQDITASGSTHKSIALEIVEDRKAVGHKDKFGKRYRRKY